jgi:hypothetical protein
MSFTSGLFLCFCAAGVVSTAFAQTTPPKAEFTARELFYSAMQAPASPKPAPATPAPAAANPPAKTVVAKRLPVKPPAPVTTAQASPAAERSDDVAQHDGARFVRASNPVRTTAPAPDAGPALGLKYTILQQSGSDWNEVPADETFHAGDHIRFKVEPNGPGYLYIVSRGSSGTWKPIFPSPEVENGDNRVEGWHAHMMPPGARIGFNEQTGVERIFIVFSRAPEPDLENLIYSLQGDHVAKPASTTQESPKSQHVLVASNDVNIEDATVGRLRKTYARDLIVEKVDDNGSGDQKEKATYVVNPTGSAESRVVADIELVHK